jgi:predicted PurR-regulated permease PerM
MALYDNRSQVSAKTAATVSVTVLGIAFAAWFFWNTTGALLVVTAALLVAVALNRPIEWLERRRVPRPLGIAIAMIALLCALAGVGFLFIPPVVSQVEELVKQWPHLVSAAERTHLYRMVQQHLHVAQPMALIERHGAEAVGSALSAVQFLLTGVAGVVTVLFVTLFMLAMGGPLVRAGLAQAKPDRRGTYARVLAEIYDALGGYVRGHLLIVLVQCAATTIVLAIAGLPFYLPLGLASGLASLIPFAGVTIVGTVVSLVAWGTRGLAIGVAIAAYYVVYQQFENHVLYPVVYRRTVKVNPLVIIVAVLFLAEWGGIPGAILAVPLTAAAHIVLGALLRARRERLGIRPAAPAGAAPLHH